MTADREQIRRDAEEAAVWAEPDQAGILARHCLSLLAELERTETEANNLIQHWCEVAEERLHRALVAEAKLTDVRVLVEALKYCARSGAADSATARKALAAWEDE